MSNSDITVVRDKSLAKGIIAGLIAGLVGTAAKTFAERIFLPSSHDEPNAPEIVAERIAGHELAPEGKTVEAQGIHWGFGATLGAAYGAVAEFYPAATAKDGASFGMAVGALIHEGALPAPGHAADPQDQTARERTSEMTSHVVYGVVTEMVRRFVRKVV